MSVIAIAAFCLLASGSSPVVRCMPTTTISTLTSTSNSPYEYALHTLAHARPRPSLRNLFLPGLFMFRPSMMESEIKTFDVKPVIEIEDNDISEEEPTTTQTPLPPPPPPPSASVFSRFNALKDRLNLEKAILPPMPLVHQVSSDQVVKKIIYTAPRLSDTIPDITMTE